jgi:hypothetical protein
MYLNVILVLAALRPGLSETYYRALVRPSPDCEVQRDICIIFIRYLLSEGKRHHEHEMKSLLHIQLK